MLMAGSGRINDNGHLEIGGCDTVELAGRYGTPLYVMDERLIRENCRRYQNALKKAYPFGEIFYAGKAFLIVAMAALINEEGLGLDVVSGGELFTAGRAGFSPGRICFHGNNKSREEIAQALEAGVGRIVVDSLSELEELLLLTDRTRERPVILLRIRPGIEVHTHSYIQTGQEDSKFGFGLQDEDTWRAINLALLNREKVELCGFHCHIGSQIFQNEPFALAAEAMFDFMVEVKEKTGFIATQLSMGGGLGIRYTKEDRPPSIETFVEFVAARVKNAAAQRKFPLPQLLLEPGRSIVGEAGTTLYCIGTIKDIPGVRRYVAVDGGMADNIRPALYQAVYGAALANRAGEKPSEMVTIAGKACESGDILIQETLLPPVEKGDLLAVFSTGAYCYAMASNYNRTPRPAVLFVGEGKARVVARRETYEDLIRLEKPI
ncbi:MAG TPA: diaminopimelate decarboxylase [Firmicutes bacterium]|nr:diaminopimelate decarboxylase [Bacillota bacterium]